MTSKIPIGIIVFLTTTCFGRGDIKFYVKRGQNLIDSYQIANRKACKPEEVLIAEVPGPNPKGLVMAIFTAYSAGEPIKSDACRLHSEVISWAKKKIVQVLSATLSNSKKLSSKIIIKALYKAFEAANALVNSTIRREIELNKSLSDNSSLGVEVALVFHPKNGKSIFVANLGRPKVRVYKNGAVITLSESHTPRNFLERTNERDFMSDFNTCLYKGKSPVTRSLGDELSSTSSEPSIKEVEISPQHILVLTSPGIQEKIAKIKLEKLIFPHIKTWEELASKEEQGCFKSSFWSPRESLLLTPLADSLLLFANLTTQNTFARILPSRKNKKKRFRQEMKEIEVFHSEVLQLNEKFLPLNTKEQKVKHACSVHKEADPQPRGKSCSKTGKLEKKSRLEIDTSWMAENDLIQLFKKDAHKFDLASCVARFLGKNESVLKVVLEEEYPYMLPEYDALSRKKLRKKLYAGDLIPPVESDPNPKLNATIINAKLNACLKKGATRNQTVLIAVATEQ